MEGRNETKTTEQRQTKMNKKWPAPVTWLPQKKSCARPTHLHKSLNAKDLWKILRLIYFTLVVWTLRRGHCGRGRTKIRYPNVHELNSLRTRVGDLLKTYHVGSKNIVNDADSTDRQLIPLIVKGLTNSRGIRAATHCFWWTTHLCNNSAVYSSGVLYCVMRP